MSSVRPLATGAGVRSARTDARQADAAFGATAAAVLRDGVVSQELIETPRIGPGELLVDVDLATVCGADRAAATGSGPARVLGHEGVGRVLEAGRGAPAATGDRIVWSPTISCGKCDRCRGGLTAACRKARVLGEQPVDGAWALSGTFARRLVLPRGAAVAQVPPELCDPVAAAAGCAAACVLSAYERAGSLPGTRVLILGAGLLGLTAAAYANDGGAASIAVADRDAARRTLARMFGATEAVDPADGLPDADVIIDFTRSGELISAGLGALTVGGRLIMVEQHRAVPVADTGRIALDGHRATAGWHAVSGVSGAEPHHLIAAVSYLAAARARWPWEQLITSAVPMSYLPTMLASPAPIAPRTAVQPRR